MRSRTMVSGVALLATALAVLPATAQNIVARLGGFDQPESATYDPSTGAIYVSNINSPDFSLNGLGYISLLSPDGTVVEQYWVDGLNGPKGTSFRDGTLWVAAADGIVEIDTFAQAVRNHYPAEGAQFLNDIFAADDGRVFVTDTFASAIYVLENGVVSLFVQDPMLAGANGITIVGNTMYIATLGDVSQGFANLQPSNIKTVDLATRAVADYGSPAGIGGLDGIEPAEGGMMVTDNGGGRLLLVAPDGAVTVIAEVGEGAADFELVADQNFAVVPMLNTGEVLIVGVP